jgi:hypothetical protein
MILGACGLTKVEFKFIILPVEKMNEAAAVDFLSARSILHRIIW